MILTNMAKLLWLLCMIVSVSASASDQYALTPDDGPRTFPYICNVSTSLNISLWPKCCPGCSKNTLCPGMTAFAIKATNATEILGAINVVHNDRSTTVKSLADLSTRRNFITSTLVDDLKLDGEIQEFSDVDIHSIEISGRNVTITTFVLLSIGIGIDNKLITDKIFEIIPAQQSFDGDLTTSNLTLGLSFLNDAGALGINQAIFINN